ncbi:RNA polymerase sigma factor [Constantimarinum furrinae]|uniref:RNA polymerase subunit sigma-24 n=1 Tax=Constantimarinum furrinae TaxID=2562285 RepID=A0A7G8PXR1_9FLAO|nr:RNA polymerase sigma factor [Constantimarinum furrinae]QNJ99127.1 RNA polymerase subunit sigma-24 [Constantimarinum furrinae]
METAKRHELTQHKITEVEVIQRVLRGEKELYEILVRRNNQKLYRVVRSYLKDNADIEDVMQNTYLSAFSKLYQFKMESSFSTWLIRIGINQALARLKDKGKLIQINDQLDSLRSGAILEIQDRRQLNPQDKMIQQESRLLLENAIDSLPVKYKAVYILKEVEEMSLKEVAVSLELSLANVKIRLHRAKEMLKDKLYEITNDKNVFEFGFSKCDRLTEKVMKMII